MNKSEKFFDRVSSKSKPEPNRTASKIIELSKEKLILESKEIKITVHLTCNDKKYQELKNQLKMIPKPIYIYFTIQTL